jgi:hypothetical protein
LNLELEKRGGGGKDSPKHTTSSLLCEILTYCLVWPVRLPDPGWWQQPSVCPCETNLAQAPYILYTTMPQNLPRQKKPHRVTCLLHHVMSAILEKKPEGVDTVG